MRPLFRVFIAVALLAISAGCTSADERAASTTGDGTTGATTGGGTEAAPTTLPTGNAAEAEASRKLTAELVELRSQNDGRLALGDALDFFSSTLGEVPGGDPTRFEPRPGDATMALMAVGAHWEELTAE